MKRILKTNFLFYLKSLMVYGVLIALLHCPSMQNEHKYDEHSIDSAVQNLNGMVTEVGSCPIPDSNLKAKSVYPYARMMNIMEQCGSVESEFRVGKVDVSFDRNERLESIKGLYSRSAKLVLKLKEEKRRFDEYVAGTRARQVAGDVRYVCTKGKCRYAVESDSAFHTDREALSKRKRRKKATRYTSQVLDKYIDQMEFVSGRLKAVIDRAHREDAAAKARSESQARAIMEQPK